MTALALVAETLANATDANAETTTKSTLRDATPADASLLADALAREMDRQYRAIVDSDAASSDPYALATRGKAKEQGRKRTLGTTLGALKVARDRYNAVFAAWQVACAELTDATRDAARSVNVEIASVAESLGIAFNGASDEPIGKLASERAAKEAKERALKEAKIAERREGALRVIAEREARDRKILALELEACGADDDKRARVQAAFDKVQAKREKRIAEINAGE